MNGKELRRLADGHVGHGWIGNAPETCASTNSACSSSSFLQAATRYIEESGGRIIQNACWGSEKSDAAVITDFGVGVGVGVGVGGGGRHWLTITSDSPLGAAVMEGYVLISYC